MSMQRLDISGWDAAAALVVAAWLYGLAAPTCHGPAPAASLADSIESKRVSGDGRPQPIFGASAYDVFELATLADGRDWNAVVASFSGRDELSGPLWTRTPELDTWLPESAAQAASTESVGGGWWRVRWPDEDADSSRRLPRELQLSTARVSVRDDKGNSTACTRVSFERFQCNRPKWAFTGRHRAKVRGSKRACIWSHPLKNRTTIVDYGTVPPAPNGRRYVLETALDDRVVDGKGAVDVDIRLGDRTLRHRTPSRKGWRRRELPKIDEPTSLALHISADRVGRRHFCFRFTLR